MSMDLKSRTEQSGGFPVLGLQVPGPRLEFCLENTARGEGDKAMKCAQKLEKTNSKAAFPPFSSSLNGKHGKLILKGKFGRSYRNSAGFLFQ